MTPCTRVLLACTLALILVPCAQAQTRKSFGAWTVVCSGGPTGYCSASNRIKSVAGPYRFQLNVSRERPGAAFELALLTGYQHPGEGSVIAIQVDAGKPLRLSPREGYRRAGRSNTYIVAAGETERLLTQMRSAKRARFRFEDAKGARIEAGFPLVGLSAAMNFMDKMQPAPQRRVSGAAAPPAAKPPAVDETKPAQAGEAVPGTKAAPTATESASSRTAMPAPIVKEVAPAPTAAPGPPAKQATAVPAPIAKEVAPAPTAAPPPLAKQVTPAPTAAPAPLTKQVTPAPTTAPAPLAKQVTPSPTTAPAPLAKQVTPAPTAVPVPPVKQAAPAPVTVPAAPAKDATPAPTAAPTPIPEPKSKPAPAQTTETALAPEQRPASEPRRKPAQAQKQAAVTAAPTASRKRGAKSIRQFSCRGSEPSWTFVIDGEHARYASLTESSQPDSIELAGKLTVTGDGPTPIVDWRGKSDWGGSFRAVVTEGRCRDSMSDSEGQTEFEYLARVTLPGGKGVRGCCNAGLPPVMATTPTDTTQYPVADLRKRPETDWSRYLFDFLPAIQACIDKTPEPDPYATKAWPMNRGMVGVRTRNAQGGWFECVAEANGKSIDRFVPLPSAAPPAPNEDRVVFSPPDHPPPAGSCYEHERVMDGMGDFLGWLSTNGCS
jgi:uncharacterized membrane protein